MNDDRPIKMHLNEEMREYIAFVLRRYRNDRLRIIEQTRPEYRIALSREIDLTNMCLKEADEAGT